jgi:hypothetical protein
MLKKDVLTANTSKAHVKTLTRGVFLTDWQIFETVFGAWVEEKILPAAEANRQILLSIHKHHDTENWKPITYEELLEYYLLHLLTGEKHCIDEQVEQSEVAAARSQITLPINRVKALNSIVNFGDEVFLNVVSAIPFYVAKLIEPGGAVTLDEAIWAAYSPKGEHQGLLCYIPDKPHQRGLLSYLCCQRLYYSNLPFAFAFAPTFVRASPTAREALRTIIGSLPAQGFALPPDWILVADSLWSFPGCLSEIMELGWKYAISVKSISATVPKALQTVAATDLILGQARTYNDSFSILQVYHSDRGISNILTNAFSELGSDPPPTLPPFSY